MNAIREAQAPSREQLLHALYEAAELEHNLMCTYLYAAFSLRDGEAEGLSAAEAEAVARWRRTILDVAIEEMGHLTAVWNITAALGGSPRFGRGNFPLDPGALPAERGREARAVQRRGAAALHLPRAARRLDEPDGEGFAPEFAVHARGSRPRSRRWGSTTRRWATFYDTLDQRLRAFVARTARQARSAAIPRCSSRRRKSTSRARSR